MPQILSQDAPFPAARSNAADRVRRPLRAFPDVADLVFATILVWLFFVGHGAQALLADADIGWHIRLGEMVLDEGRLPATDPFSFTMEGQVWYAWEWLADVVFAAAHRLAGLTGVVWLAGAVIAATASATLRFLLWTGANLFFALGATFLICGVSTVHWLARPHMFTWGLLLATLWLLEADRRKHSPRVWLLAPLMSVWVNLHGGFLAGIATIALFGAGAAAEQFIAEQRGRERWRWFVPPVARRYGALLAAACASTLLNPFGWRLHAHIADFLGSDFILKHVQEFQSPVFRSEPMMLLEAAIFGALLIAGWRFRKGECAWPLLAIAWAHAALTSVRHAPLFVIVAAPLLAGGLTELWKAGLASRRGFLIALDEIAADYGGRATARPGWGVWLPLLALTLIGLLLAFPNGDERWRARFPSETLPVAASESLGDRLAKRRVLTTDQWADYLIYRYHPDFKAFFDGRSDFYGPEIGEDYLLLQSANRAWPELLNRYGFEAALLPADWPLSSVLKLDLRWTELYEDDQATYFERRQPSPR